jgi:hypothetical protein
MPVKLICSVCKEEINDLWISIEKLSLRKDMTIVNSVNGRNNLNPFLVEYDREYFSGNVDEIGYTCKCGMKSITKNKAPKSTEKGKVTILDDFIRDGGQISYDDLTNTSYGDLLVVYTPWVDKEK